MKRKRLDRDLWGFDKYPYYQAHIDIEGFHGLVCLIKLSNRISGADNAEYQYWNFPRAGKAAVFGEGMIWLQLIPNGKSHVLTAMYLPDCKVSIWYADIIENMEFDPDGVAVFIDKYLDVIFTPQGDVKVDDRDELDEALRSGDITKEQFDLALKECEQVLNMYCSDISETEAMCNKILSLVLEK